MKAIQADGGKLVWGAVDEEQCAPGLVKIDVAATAINRADLVQVTGGYPPPPGASPILGLECAGVVSEVGEGVQRVKVGDEVCALLAGGGYAERVVVPAGQVLPIPSGLSLLQAAAIPEVFATAYLNLYMEAGLSTGERVIVHAGASGVGTAAIQMLKQTSNPVFITAGSQQKIDQCIELGADAGHDRHSGSFVDTTRSWCADGGVDVILDPVGAQYLADNLNLLRLNGRLVLIGLMSGATTEINLGLMMMKRLRLIGSTLRARPIGEKAQVMDELLQNIWPHFASGVIKPIIEASFPIEQAQKAHELVASNETIGKVLLQVS